MTAFLEFLDIQFKQQFYIVQIIFAEALFAIGLERRKHFWLRLGLSLIVYAALCFLLPPLLFSWRDRFVYVLIWVLSVLIFPVCFKSNLFDQLFCVLAALLMQNLSNNLGVLACDLFRIDPDAVRNPASGLLQVPVYLATHVVCYFLCARRLIGKRNFGSERRMTIVLLVVSTTCIFLLYNSFVSEGLEYNYVVYSLLAVCDLLSLLVLFGASAFQEVQREKADLEDLLRREKDFREYSRHAVEIINLKSHDLKHYLSLMKSGVDVDDEHIRETEEAILFYEAAAKTDNSVLNTILTEKMIICSQHAIKFSYVVDEHCLDGLRPIDLASILNNILDNAIQYLFSVEESRRLVTLNIFERQGFSVIRCENYCAKPPEMRDGLPVTTNSDKDFHGFGLQSVRRIVRQRGGHMTIDVSDEQFVLDIMFPKTRQT